MSKTNTPWWSILKYIVLGLLLFSLIGYISTININDIKIALQKIGINYGWVLLSTFVAYALGTLSWLYCFPKSEMSKISFWQLFGIRLIGENVAIINPANFIGGESAKIWLLEKKGVPYAIGTSSILLSRVILMTSQVALFIITSALYMVLTGSFEPTLTFIMVVSVLILLGIALLFFLLNRSKKYKDKLKKKASLQKLFQTINEARTLIKKKFKTEKQLLFFATLSCIAHWIAGALELWLIFNLLGFEISVLEAIVMDNGIILLKSLGAFVPGQIGVEEYANKVLFAVINIVDTTIWITVSLLRRFRQLIWMIIGISWYFILKRLNNEAITQQ